MKKNDKACLIWSSDIDPDVWRADFEEDCHERLAFCEELNVEYDGYDPESESDLYQWAMETNDSYLDDERTNLDIDMGMPIICIGDLGRWNGRVPGYRMVDSGNIKDCLYSDADFTEWYVNAYGNLRATASHHDGVNFYLYRVFKEGVTAEQINNFQNKILNGAITKADITRYTKRLGDAIADVYGFDFIGRKKEENIHE